MSYEPFTALCKRVRTNNGIVEALFVRSADYADAGSQEEHVMVNVAAARGPYIEGEPYWIEIQPARPR